MVLRNENLPGGPVVRHWRAAVLCILLTSVVLSCALALAKRPWCDEAWFASPAYNLAYHGTIGTTILDPHGFAYTPDLKGVDRFTYWIMPGYILAQAAWYRVVGFSLFSMRLLSIVWSAIALLSWFVVVNWITGSRRVSLLALLLLATEQQFIRSAAFGRMDLMCVALGLSALAAYLHFRESRFLLAMAASSCLATLAMVTHPNGLFSTLILTGFVVWLDRGRLHFRTLLVAAIPALLIAGAWALYIVQEPGLFLAQIHSQSSFLSFLGSPVRMLAAEISERYSEPYGLTAPFPVLLGSLVFYSYLLAISLALAVPSLRGNRGSRVLLILTLFQFAALLLVKKSWYYLVYILPFYTSLLAVVLDWVLLQGRVWRFVACAAVILITLVNTGFILVRVQRRDIQQFEAAVKYLKATGKPGELVMGSGELGFELGFDGQVIDDCRLGFLSGKVPAAIVIEPQYRSFWFPWIQTHEPAAYDHVSATLKRYDLVYNRPRETQYRRPSVWSYQIYRQPASLITH